MKSGGPEYCPRPCSDCPDRRHHWLPICPEPDDPDYIDHPAVLQGLEAFFVCKHCDAWIEDIEDR
jgi:hypothetical protein